MARIAEMPATRRPAERRSLTQDQAEALLKAAEGERLEALSVTGLMLGLRPGELEGLLWSDIHDDHLEISGTLEHERVGPPGTPKVWRRKPEVKTPRSRRSLRRPPPVIAALKDHRPRQGHERLLAGPEWQKHGFVFTTRPANPSPTTRSPTSSAN
jgi:integrase